MAIQREKEIDFARYQDIFGQLRLLKSYSHLLLCFPIPDDIPRESVIQDLQKAAIKVTTAFPFLAGRVTHEGSSESHSGVFKVTYSSDWAPPKSILRVKDCSDICPSYAEVIRERGPVTMFDAKTLAPCVAFPQSYQESEFDPFVSALQANFIKGGLLLDVAAQHNIMDASGMLQLLSLVAKAMRGEEFSPQELNEGNRDRRNMVRLLGPDEPLIDHSAFSRPSLLEKKIPAVPAPHGRWTTFCFTKQKLAELKALASDSLGFDPSIPFISTNDALTAFIWKRISAVRLRRLQKPDAISKFTRAVDARSALEVPREYMGHMVYNSFTRLTFKEIEEAPLSVLASMMRKNLKSDVTEYSVRSFVTLLANTPDKTTIMYGGDMDRELDVGFTSIAQADMYSVGFGILGKPQLLRRPHFIPKTTTVYLLPKTEGGDIESLMCLSEEDMKELKEDEEWQKYSQTIE